MKKQVMDGCTATAYSAFAMSDVATAFQMAGRQAKIIGGRYGLSSKEFNTAMVKAIYDEMQSPTMKQIFTVGIDDVRRQSNFDRCLAAAARQSIRTSKRCNQKNP